MLGDGLPQVPGLVCLNIGCACPWLVLRNGLGGKGAHWMGFGCVRDGKIGLRLDVLALPWARVWVSRDSRLLASCSLALNTFAKRHGPPGHDCH